MKWHLTNTITFLRILISPFVYYAGFIRAQTLFIVLFAIGGLTDAFDGFFARRLKQESEWGTKWDAIADIIFYPSTLMIYFFVPQVITDNLWIILSGIGVIVFASVIGALRGKLVYPHLVSSKTFAVLAYFFTLYTLIFEYSVLFFYITIFVGWWATIELFILLCFKSPKIEQKWVWE